MNPPEWANFFNNEEFNLFISLVKDYFKHEHIEITIQDGIINSEKLGLLFLQNLAKLCKLIEKKKDWKNYINKHFNNLQESKIYENVFNKEVEVFAEIKDSLAIRLYSKNFLGEYKKILDDMCIYKEDIKGILSVLVYDLPTTIRIVNPSHLRKWNKNIDELFKIGLDNLRKKNILKFSLKKYNGVKLFISFSDNFFIPSLILQLEHFPKYIGKYGSLIGLPNRHTVICYPIKNIKVIQAINTLIPILYKSENESPGGISPFLYWYYEKQFFNIPYRISQGKLDIMPTENITEILNKIANSE